MDTQYITATAPGLATFVYYITNDQDPFLKLVEYVYSSWQDEDIGPSVISISYGGDEYEFGEDYLRRINQEFGKLALLGITVLASSDDQGAVGITSDDDCLRKGINGELNVTNGTEIYSVSFPASAPYVTAVGGTEGGSAASDGVTGETAWMYSGGGFSDFFKR